MLGCLVLVLSLAPVGVNLVRKSHAMFWKIQNTDHLSRQVHYGFQISGSNYPPFGCLQTGTTTEALNLRYSLSTWSSYSDTENVEDVGSPHDFMLCYRFTGILLSGCCLSGAAHRR